MSTKVEVFTSPGWEAEVDTDWAEGLFAVFLRSAKGGKRPRTGTKALGKNEPSDSVILLTVRKDGEINVEQVEVTPAPVPPLDGTPTSPASETRRTRKPRRPDEGTAKLRDSAPPDGAGRSGSGRRGALRSKVAAPPPPPPPSSPRRPIPPVPPPPPPRVRLPTPAASATAAAPPARPPRSTVVPAAISREQTVRETAPPDMRITVPAALKTTPLDDEGIRSFLFEMGALVKYGHRSQVRAEFDKKTPQHAEDPRFRRLAIDFYFEHAMQADAIDALFGLASLYFDRHDMPRMRECLDEILQHEPGSRRARKMRELLDKRPGRSRAPSSGGR